MKNKMIALILLVFLTTSLVAGCTEKVDDATDKTETTTGVDAITSASIVSDAGALKKAFGKEGNYVVAIINDITTTDDLIFEGDFYDKNDTAKPLYHKLALYAQNDKFVVTERYTLTAPKITIKSTNTRIQGGTFKGDVYVEANGFTIYDATVDGNIYFSMQEYKDSFVLTADEGKEGKVTGKIELLD